MYIKIINGQPEIYSIEQLRRDNPNVSFPKTPSDALLAEWDVYPFMVQDQPTYDYVTQTTTATPIAEVNGIWTQGWAISSLPPEDAARNVRSKRDMLLSETDWMALSDVTMTAPWAAYRQQLRDITLQVGFPYNITWPVKTE